MSWFFKVMREGFNFQGRARRKEYWMFSLVAFVLMGILTWLDATFDWWFAQDLGVTSTILGLLLFIPNLAVSVRRLHDIGKSGWWLLLLALIPIVGPIILLIMFCFDSQDHENMYGNNPKTISDGLLL